MATSYHIPVLAGPVVEALRAAPPGPIVDGTAGGGGHLRALFEATQGQRPLIGVDKDPEACRAARARFQPGDPVTVVHGDFATLGEAVARAGVEGDHAVSGLLLDLGVSSWQLDTPARGFAFKHGDAPLDMRMDPSSDRPTAAELIASLTEEELARVLARYGEVRRPRAVARALQAASRAGALQTTGDLARVAAEALGRRHEPGARASGGAGKRSGRIHPATTVFQALRIAVNDELAALDAALAEAPRLLCPGGRLAIISYHSLEDRRVKRALREGERGPARPAKLPPPTDWTPTWEVLTRRPVVADEAERRRNPRARSAKLRVAARAPLPNADAARTTPAAQGGAP